MPQYKVPQNIDLEDKIVGPFTMKQFIYLMVGGGLIYGLYQMWLPYENGIYYTIAAGIPIGFAAFLLTFIKINDRPFEYFLISLWAYIFKPRRRIWQQGYEFRRVVLVTPAQEKINPNASSGKRATLDEIAQRLESQASNTGSVLPAAKTEPQDTITKKPHFAPTGATRGGQDTNAPSAQPVDARFTVEDLKRGQDAVNPKSKAQNPNQAQNLNVQNGNPPPSANTLPSSEPVPPPKPTAASVLKGISGIFSKAGAQDANASNPQSAASATPSPPTQQHSHF